jgi:hypothetical protein
MAVIMYAQLILDKPSERVLNVLTLNKEAVMEAKAIKTEYVVMVDGGASYKADSLKTARKDRSARMVHEYRGERLVRTIELERSAEIALRGKL